MPTIYKTFRQNRSAVLYNGDCMDLLDQIPRKYVDITVTSPPYCIGKEYDESSDVDYFFEEHIKLIPRVVEATKVGGSICWQIGYHVKNGAIVPLDYLVHPIFSKFSELTLRNRIIWTFGHGTHSKSRFSGRHEMILWYTKGPSYAFDLDSIRVTQKYPGKRHYKGKKKGRFSGNPLGKNPSDVWDDIPNVKANHVEKTQHPCQFPVALVVRLIKSLCPPGGIVFDPYMGSGSTGVAALLERRKFIGAELSKTYYSIALARVRETAAGSTKYRPLEKPVLVPDPNMDVAKKPAHFK